MSFAGRERKGEREKVYKHQDVNHHQQDFSTALNSHTSTHTHTEAHTRTHIHTHTHTGRERGGGVMGRRSTSIKMSPFTNRISLQH